MTTLHAVSSKRSPASCDAQSEPTAAFYAYIRSYYKLIETPPAASQTDRRQTCLLTFSLQVSLTASSQPPSPPFHREMISCQSCQCTENKSSTSPNHLPLAGPARFH